MDETLQLDTEQVLKLLELGLENSEKVRMKDSKVYNGEERGNNEYPTPDTVPGSSIGIAKIINAHLSNNNPAGLNKDNTSTLLRGQNSYAYNERGRSELAKREKTATNNFAREPEKESSSSRGSPETDQLIAQLKEKIEDVNLISNDIKRRLDGQKNGEARGKEKAYRSTSKIRLRTPNIEADDRPQKTKSPGSDDGSDCSNNSEEDSGRLDTTQLKAIMSKLLTEKQKLIAQNQGAPNVGGGAQLTHNTLSAGKPMAPSSPPPYYQHHDHLVGGGQRRLDRKLSEASDTSGFCSDVSITQSPEPASSLVCTSELPTPSPSYTRGGGGGVGIGQDGGARGRGSPEFHGPVHRSLSQLTLDSDFDQGRRRAAHMMPRKLSMDQSINQLTNLRSNLRSNSVFSTRSEMGDQSEVTQDELNKSGVDKKNPAIRKLVYSQYREMLKSYSAAKQKTTST